MLVLEGGQSDKDARLILVAVEGLVGRKHDLKSLSQRQGGKCLERWE